MHMHEVHVENKTMSAKGGQIRMCSEDAGRIVGCDGLAYYAAVLILCQPINFLCCLALHICCVYHCTQT